MRIIIAIIIAFSAVKAGINPLKDFKKENNQNIKISERYVAYISKKDPNIFVIRDKEQEFNKYKNGEEFKYKEINIYEDNGAYLLPTGKFKVKNYKEPKRYYTKERMAKIIGFENCETYNRTTYDCYSTSNEFYKKIVKNKIKIEKTHNISIEIEYLYLFK